jgi:hypothetical protein
MEHGKTTLTAGLVRAGFGYLTDEAVAIDAATLNIDPYPKPLSLDPGSWSLFPELADERAGRDTLRAPDQWLIPSHAFRGDALGQPCPARFIVYPRYDATARTALEQLDRGEALVELTTNTFKFKDNARESLDVLAETIRGAECYRLTVGELHDAVSAIQSLVGTSATRRAS